MPMISNLSRAVRRAYRRTVDLSHPARSPLGSAVVNCVVYREGGRQPGDWAPAEAIRRARKGRGFVWIGPHTPPRLRC
ncbi:magnesium transporter CorA, partial [Streptomyces sp. WAC 06725]